MNQAKTDEQKDFESFMQARAEAGESFVNGDPAGILALTTRHAASTFFGPGGGYVSGVEEVIANHAQGAQAFEPGGSNELEILQLSASGRVAYWVGLQHSTVRRRGTETPVPLKLRVTEIYRHEDGGWKLVHRHADLLAGKP